MYAKGTPPEYRCCAVFRSLISSAQVAGLLARLAHRTPKTCAIWGWRCSPQATPSERERHGSQIRASGGDTDAKAVASLSHAEVIQQYKVVDQLPAEERATVIKVIAALLRDYKARKAYS